MDTGVSRIRAASLSITAAAILMAGCGLEAPQAPRFDTIVNLPLREELFTGLEMAGVVEESPYGGDAAGDQSVGGICPLRAGERLVLEAAQCAGDPFLIETDSQFRERVTRNLQEVVILVDVENHFSTGVELRLHFAPSAEALFLADELVVGSDEVTPAPADSATGRVAAPATSQIELRLTRPDQLRMFAAEGLFGALEVTLLGDGGRPLEIWTTDYVRVSGVVAFHCRVE